MPGLYIRKRTMILTLLKEYETGLVIQWQRRFYCPKRRFRIVFESYRFMPFQMPFEGKNGV